MTGEKRKKKSYMNINHRPQPDLIWFCNDYALNFTCTLTNY